jgi:hypothetical protein
MEVPMVLVVEVLVGRLTSEWKRVPCNGLAVQTEVVLLEEVREEGTGYSCSR